MSPPQAGRVRKRRGAARKAAASEGGATEPADAHVTGNDKHAADARRAMAAIEDSKSDSDTAKDTAAGDSPAPEVTAAVKMYREGYRRGYRQGRYRTVALERKRKRESSSEREEATVRIPDNHAVRPHAAPRRKKLS